MLLRIPGPNLFLSVLVALFLVGPARGAGTNAVDPAARFARATDLEARRAILRSLNRSEDPRATDLVVSVLKDPRKNADALPEAIAAAERLSNIYITSALIELAPVSLPTNVLIQVIETLGRKGSTDGIAAIAPHLRSSDARVRAAASTAIGRSGGMPAINAALAVLSDPSPAARRSALEALAWFKHPRLIGPAMEAAASPETRREAMFVLAGIPDVRALDPLVEGLGADDALLRDRCRRTLALMQTEILAKLEERATSFIPRVLRELRRIYSTNETAKAGVLFKGELSLPDANAYRTSASGQKGDAARGMWLLENRTGMGCVECHDAAGGKRSAAPNLAGVGRRLSRAQLMDAMLEPEKQLKKDGELVALVLRSGPPLTGIIRDETEESLTLVDRDRHEHRVLKRNIDQRIATGHSYMPAGLEAGLSLEEFADLIAALESLK